MTFLGKMNQVSGATALPPSPLADYFLGFASMLNKIRLGLVDPDTVALLGSLTQEKACAAGTEYTQL